MGTQARSFFLHGDTEISEKWNFFVYRSIPENFQRENFSRQVPTESLRTQDSENVYERWVQQIFDPVLVARSWVARHILICLDMKTHQEASKNIIPIQKIE